MKDERRERLIGTYASGGAVGATFYLEPVATLDIDIFVLFEQVPLVLSLAPCYEACAAPGYRALRDAIEIEGGRCSSCQRAILCSRKPSAKRALPLDRIKRSSVN